MSTMTGVASTAAAAATGDKILTYVTIGINAVILISNALLDIYRKWRDRDKDLKGGGTDVREKTDNNGDGDVQSKGS